MLKSMQTIKRHVLFLSGDDFKEKSIQVIRKTPEAYVKNGWKVTYFVARDSSNKGNYYYENIINPEGIDVKRWEIPFTETLNKAKNKLFIVLLVRLRRYLAIWILFREGQKFLKANSDVDVVYGYEMPGFLAARMLKKLNKTGKAPIIARFQGVVFVREWLKRSTWYRRVLNAETFFALRTKSDLCIMTNDGTQGDWVLKTLSSGHLKNLKFLVNGVDQSPPNEGDCERIRRELKICAGEHILISVSRLDDHKRVDRCIRVFASLVNEQGLDNCRYIIVGEGAKRKEFEQLASELDIADKVVFVGAVVQSQVKAYLSAGEFFLSMYEGSNVGNPLIEAIQANKIIVTLNNGDTGEWIRHKINGLIYEIDDSKGLQPAAVRKIAADIMELIQNPDLLAQLKAGLTETRSAMLWSWEERFNEEINAVKQLLC